MRSGVFLTPILGVWKADEILSLVFDVLRQMRYFVLDVLHQNPELSSIVVSLCLELFGEHFWFNYIHFEITNVTYNPTGYH